MFNNYMCVYIYIYIYMYIYMYKEGLIKNRKKNKLKFLLCVRLSWQFPCFVLMIYFLNDFYTQFIQIIFC